MADSEEKQVDARKRMSTKPPAGPPVSGGAASSPMSGGTYRPPMGGGAPRPPMGGGAPRPPRTMEPRREMRRPADDFPEMPDEVGGERQRRYTQMSERNRCRFCREKLTRVDYKDVLTLQKLCTNQGRVFPRKRSGNCAAHQRMVKVAIKQARYIALLSYTAF